MAAARRDVGRRKSRISFVRISLSTPSIRNHESLSRSFVRVHDVDRIIEKDWTPTVQEKHDEVIKSNQQLKWSFHSCFKSHDGLL